MHGYGIVSYGYIYVPHVTLVHTLKLDFFKDLGRWPNGFHLNDVDKHHDPIGMIGVQ